jgi:hypothetical protein
MAAGLACLLAAGCAGPRGDSLSGVVRGAVVAGPGVALQHDAVVVVAIVAGGPGPLAVPRIVRKPDGSRRIAYDGIGAPHVFEGPAPFERLPYAVRFNPSEIRPGSACRIAAWVLQGDTVAFVSNAPVLSGAASAEGVDLVLHPR